MWPEHCVQGTPGAQLHSGLERALIDHVVDKGTDLGIDSYSGFFDNARLRETGLRELIEREALARGETVQSVKLSVCGLALDYCVAWTALDAASIGIQTEVVLDGARAVNLTPGDDVRALRSLTDAGVAIRESTEILAERGRETEREAAPLGREPTRPVSFGLRA